MIIKFIPMILKKKVSSPFWFDIKLTTDSLGYLGFYCSSYSQTRNRAVARGGPPGLRP